MTTKPHIVILGAGPAGLGAAFQLTRRELASVTVLEQCKNVGGAAKSFELSGIQVDYGSHRLHPACDPEILRDIQTLLGDDLLDRPRHGRIRLRAQWIHFPLKPFDLAVRLPPDFAFATATDLIGKFLKRKTKSHSEKSFASVLKAGLGQTICEDFYFPYAQKIWGLHPEELSVTQAKRRVSANSMGKMFKKLLNAVPGIRSNGAGRFFYPRGGFGQISESLYKVAVRGGAEFHTGIRVKSIETENKKGKTVYSEQDGNIVTHRADYVWSTIPIPFLVKCLQPPAPLPVIQASENIDHRAMILIYLVLEQEQFSEFDAHYFPEMDIPITRISEPKNYSGVLKPQNRTVLCAELPCFTTDPVWHMKDEDLGKLVCDCLKLADIAVKAPIKEVTTRRLPQAYPVYRKGFDVYFNQIDRWLSGIENLLTFGRQGLFVHDNIHHALYMGYSATKCLNEDGYFDQSRWQTFRQVFDTHVVED